MSLDSVCRVCVHCHSDDAVAADKAATFDRCWVAFALVSTDVWREYTSFVGFAETVEVAARVVTLVHKLGCVNQISVWRREPVGNDI